MTQVIWLEALNLKNIEIQFSTNYTKKIIQKDKKRVIISQKKAQTHSDQPVKSTCQVMRSVNLIKE